MQVNQWNPPPVNSYQGYLPNPYISNPYMSNPYMQNPYNDVIAESVKRELMAEIEAQRAARMAESAGYGQVLSDQKLNKLIEQRYRTLEDVKNDIRKELQAIQTMENRGLNTNSDPYIREIAQAIAMEAQQQGVPMNQVIQTMNTKGGNGVGLWGRMSNFINTGQRKGFLYGIGTGVLIYLLMPFVRNNRHTMAFSSMDNEMPFEDRLGSDDDTLDE